MSTASWFRIYLAEHAFSFGQESGRRRLTSLCVMFFLTWRVLFPCKSDQLFRRITIELIENDGRGQKRRADRDECGALLVNELHALTTLTVVFLFFFSLASVIVAERERGKTDRERERERRTHFLVKKYCAKIDVIEWMEGEFQRTPTKVTMSSMGKTNKRRRRGRRVDGQDEGGSVCIKCCFVMERTFLCQEESNDLHGSVAADVSNSKQAIRSSPFLIRRQSPLGCSNFPINQARTHLLSRQQGHCVETIGDNLRCALRFSSLDHSLFEKRQSLFKHAYQREDRHRLSEGVDKDRERHSKWDYQTVVHAEQSATQRACQQ